MRKRYVLVAAVSLLALAFAGVAIASPQFTQSVKIKYSTKKGKRAAGVSLSLIGKDPGATPPGNQPGAAKVVIQLKGAKVNTKAGHRCTLSKSNAANCPSNTKVGSGSALANLCSISAPVQCGFTGIKNNVVVYLKTGGLFVVVKGTTLPTVVVLDTKFSKRGTLTVNVAKDVGSPAPNQKLVLTDFNVKVKKVTSGSGSKRKILLRTPKCGSSKKFKFVTKFAYDDGTSKTIKTSQKCRK